jgi:hypothetical protein
VAAAAIAEDLNSANPHDNSGIITGSKSAFTSPSSNAPTISPNGHRVNSQQQDNEVGQLDPQTHVPVNGMLSARSHPRGAELHLEPR